MLDYTKASLTIIMEDIRKYALMFKKFSLVFTTGYFIYVLITKTGFFAVNIILASLFFLYTIFELVASKKDIKNIQKAVKKSYHWIVLGLKLFTLSSLIYSIYTASTEISPLTTIFTTVMIVLWILQVFLEIVISVFENKIDLLVAGWNKDLEDIKKPITGIKNFFKKAKGEEIPPTPPKSKELIRLEKKIEAQELEKKSRKVVKPLKNNKDEEKSKESKKSSLSKVKENDKLALESKKSKDKDIKLLK